MTATSQPQDTAVTLPAVSAPALAELVAELQSVYPGDPRGERAVGVLLSGRLHDTATLGTYVVTCPRGAYYVTRAFSCTCPDATQRQLTCKHQLAVQLLHAMSAASRRERLERDYSPIPYVLTDKGLAASREPVGAA
jgi:hypothetical protein